MKRGFCPVTDGFFRKVFRAGDGKTLPYIKGVEVDGQTAIVRLQGEINANTIPMIQSNCKDATHLDKNVLLDFGEVTQIDSATLASLVLKMKDLRSRDRRLAILNMSSMMKKFIDITRLDGVLDSYEDEDAALSSLNKV